MLRTPAASAVRRPTRRSVALCLTAGLTALAACTGGDAGPTAPPGSGGSVPPSTGTPPVPAPPTTTPPTTTPPTTPPPATTPPAETPAPTPATPAAPAPAPQPPPPAPSPSRGVVTGTAVDAVGRPLAGVRVFADNTLYYNTNAVGVTDEAGRYRIDVSQPIGTWRVSAQLLRAYHGRTYRVDLHPDDATPFPGVDGAVRHFQWRLTGETTEGTRYGARAYVYLNDSPDPAVRGVAYRDVEVTFTPDGPLVDGSTGRPAVVRLDDGFRVEDLPLGRYVVTARWLPAGGAARAMAVRLRDTGTYAESVVADWPADGDGRLQVLELEARVP